MFIQIRGTFGSGKTTVMRTIINALINDGAECKYLFDEFAKDKKGNPKIYAQQYSRKDMKPVIVIGRYGASATGGADLLSGKGTINRLENFILTEAVEGHVLMEGSIVTCLRFVATGAKLKELGSEAAYFDLSTPLEECIKRVDARRLTKWRKLEKPGEPPAQNLKGISALSKNVARLHEKTCAANLPCQWASDEALPALVLGLLK